jgi:hypothetical protein
LWHQLVTVARLVSPESDNGAQILRTRIARLYAVLDLDRLQVPTVVLVKPDQARYWTRSAGFRDGDEIAADVMMWGARATVEADSSVQ